MSKRWPLPSALLALMLCSAGCARVGFRARDRDAARPLPERGLDARADAPASDRAGGERLLDTTAPGDRRGLEPSRDGRAEARPPDGPPDGKPPDTRPPDTRPPDTRPPDTRPPDIRPPDLVLSPDLPTVGFVTTTNGTGTITCPGGKYLVGGGGSCAVGVSLTSSIPSGNGWAATCAGSTATAFAVCASAPLGPVVTTKNVASVVASFELACPGNDRVVGGGCACAAGTVLLATAPVSDTTWRCACSADGAHTGHVLCAPVALATSVGLARNGSTAAVSPMTMACQAIVPKALGGGCGGVLPLEKSAPLGSNGWYCRMSSSASNSAWAMCAR